MGPPCKETCRFKCQSKIGTKVRRELFESYWKMGDLQAQRSYVSNSMEKVAPKMRFTNKAIPREWNNNAFYFLQMGHKERVCKLFFMNTLGISDRPIRTVLRKTDKRGFLEPEKRGKHSHHKEVNEKLKEDARAFIRAIPRVESHYLRAQTNREFIHAGMTLADIYRDFLKSMEEKSQKELVSQSMFANIFNKEFNISFFTPKKDLCSLCEMCKNLPNSEEIADKYDEHQYQKVLSRISKEMDKDMAKTNKNHIVCCFDLQAVMPSPIGNASLFYYKSKVNSYNFTITNIVTGETNCYFWHEGEGNRGANEIASCVFKYLQDLDSQFPNEELEITFYSDNCCGQNKNRFIMSMFVLAVTTLRSVKAKNPIS